MKVNGDNMKNEKFEIEREIETVMKKITENPVCILCGETDPRVIEKHHLLGRKVSDITGPLCANCHRKITAGQNHIVNRAKSWKSDEPPFVLYSYAIFNQMFASEILHYFRKKGGRSG